MPLASTPSCHARSVGAPGQQTPSAVCPELMTGSLHIEYIRHARVVGCLAPGCRCAYAIMRGLEWLRATGASR
eukprot:NODE_27782_length_500_cov_4.981233.p1 GENE.NODE_27782_length_500_cov_4.981233~~NODE_27782_length_500_cov_4.981233.p1  ORF type:complete len:73 (-),score=4.07 NODE_27782_length_500_cov_4.981233:103-321(-)